MSAKSHFKLGFFRWKVTFTILTGLFAIFEVVRSVARFGFVNLPGYLSPFVLNVIVVVGSIAIIIFTWLNQKKAPLYLSIAIFYNFFTTSIIKYTDIGIFKIANEQMFGMPIGLFYVYIFIEVVIVAALFAYYFTDYLFGEEGRPRSQERLVAFDDYLKKQAQAQQEKEQEQKKGEEPDIWMS